MREIGSMRLIKSRFSHGKEIVLNSELHYSQFRTQKAFVFFSSLEVVMCSIPPPPAHWDGELRCKLSLNF